MLPFPFPLPAASLWQRFCQELCAYVNFNPFSRGSQMPKSNHARQPLWDLDLVSACRSRNTQFFAVHLTWMGMYGSVWVSAELSKLYCNDKTTAASIAI